MVFFRTIKCHSGSRTITGITSIRRGGNENATYSGFDLWHMRGWTPAACLWRSTINPRGASSWGGLINHNRWDSCAFMLLSKSSMALVMIKVCEQILEQAKNETREHVNVVKSTCLVLADLLEPILEKLDALSYD